MSGFLLGDQPAFTAHLQPPLIMSIMVSTIVGGFCDLALVYWLSVSLALSLKQKPATVCGSKDYSESLATEQAVRLSCA